MSSQDELFHEGLRDALRHAIKALGGFEAVGADIWPSKLRKHAGTWLADCLNPERPAKLDLEEFAQILSMARARGVHCAMHQLCDETGYERPGISPMKTQRQLLAEEFSRLAGELARLAEEEAAIGNAELMRGLRAIKSDDGAA